MAEPIQPPNFPQNWRLAEDWDPNKNLMNLRGKDYLNVQNRMIWFIRDQRELIMRGLAQTSYAINTECVELDREAGWAHFRTYVRDVLGNEATMYGSESMRDFPDYAEKASTKSLGRALAMLGYGTQFAPEMDEGDRVVDSPVQPPRSAARPAMAASAAPRATPAARAAPLSAARPVAAAPTNGAEAMATDRQIASIRKLSVALGRGEPETQDMTFASARDMLTQLSQAYSDARKAS
jgi:hypothetical protein